MEPEHGIPRNVAAAGATGRTQLATKSARVKVIGGIFWLIAVILLIALVVTLVDALPRMAASAATVESLVPLLVLVVLVTLWLSIVVLEAYSFGAWLEGATLQIRHWSGTRRCDLSTAAVSVRESPRGIWLTARDARSGRNVRLQLQRQQGLRYGSLLAGAITAGRPQDAGARQAAEAVVRAAAS